MFLKLYKFLRHCTVPGKDGIKCLGQLQEVGDHLKNWHFCIATQLWWAQAVPNNFRAYSFSGDNAVLCLQGHRHFAFSAFLLVLWLRTGSSYPDGNQAISLGPRELQIPRWLKVQASDGFACHFSSQSFVSFASSAMWPHCCPIAQWLDPKQWLQL